MTDLQILEKRLKRAEKSFEEGLQQYDLHLSDNARSKEENESDLDKLRVLIKRLQSAYPPVIEEYEKVTGSNTVDQKIEELGKRQRDTEFQFVDTNHALKQNFHLNNQQRQSTTLWYKLQLLFNNQPSCSTAVAGCRKSRCPISTEIGRSIRNSSPCLT